MRAISSEADLLGLPVGSVVVDLGPKSVEAASPVVACKTLGGLWQVMGQKQGTAWTTEQIRNVTQGHDLFAVYEVREAIRF